MTLDNVFYGNSGVNIFYGLGGRDTYYISQSSDVIVESDNAGFDKVYADVSYTLGNNVEVLYLTGDGAINGTGNALDNIIFSNIGQNTLTGLAGNDTYYIANANDIIIELPNEGTDHVWLENISGHYQIGENIEDATETGERKADGSYVHWMQADIKDINVTGNALNNTIFFKEW